jgi:anti-sigma regulatory factor (Ser/Thr protein kinase)
LRVGSNVMISVAVSENSQVAEARRQAVDIAQRNGFSETEAGRVAIVATELGTNLIKHGNGGEILIGTYDDRGVGGIELIALDKGKGMANVDACLADGYSSAGTPGHGLGAVFRQAHVVGIASWPNSGTAVLTRLERGDPRAGVNRPLPPWGAVSVALPGEEVNGDSWTAEECDGGRTFLVADGLGHGPDAAEASVQAVRIFQRHKGHQVGTLLDYVHGGLRATRGAAVSVARLNPERSKITFAGIGNVAGAVAAPSGIRRMVALSGTAGHVVRKIQTFEYPFSEGIVILHSDGLATSWTLDRYPGLLNAHPTLIAAVLYRDFARRRDDVTVLVGSGA